MVLDLGKEGLALCFQGLHVVGANSPPELLPREPFYCRLGEQR